MIEPTAESQVVQRKSKYKQSLFQKATPYLTGILGAAALAGATYARYKSVSTQGERAYLTQGSPSKQSAAKINGLAALRDFAQANKNPPPLTPRQAAFHDEGVKINAKSMDEFYRTNKVLRIRAPSDTNMVATAQVRQPSDISMISMAQAQHASNSPKLSSTKLQINELIAQGHGRHYDPQMSEPSSSRRRTGLKKPPSTPPYKGLSSNGLIGSLVLPKKKKNAK